MTGSQEEEGTELRHSRGELAGHGRGLGWRVDRRGGRVLRL